jgi:hypothetical protein
MYLLGLGILFQKLLELLVSALLFFGGVIY